MGEKGDIRAQLGKLGKEIPGIVSSFSQLNAEAFKDGALSVKTKTLIAVALAVGLAFTGAVLLEELDKLVIL